MNDRIFELIKELGLNNQQFAELTGISTSRLTQLRQNSDSELSPSMLNKIIFSVKEKTNKDVNRDWLYFGEGQIFRQTSNSQVRNLLDLMEENRSNTDDYEQKDVLKNTSEIFENRNIEPKKPVFIETTEKSSSEQTKIVEKVIEKIVEKPIDKKIVRITVFYDNGAFEELSV